MPFYIPSIASPYLLKEMENRLVIGKLATNISDQVEDIAWSGSEITFPVFTRSATAGEVADKGAVIPTEIDGSSTNAPIKHIASSVKWHEDTLRKSGKVLADLGIRDMADAMSTKLEADIMAEAVNSSTLRYACAAADTLTQDELEGGLALFGDKQAAQEFSGILIHSKLFPSFLKMDGFSNENLTYSREGSGIVKGQVAGFYRGIPVYLTNNGTYAANTGNTYETKTVILKKGGVGYALKKAIDFREAYNNETFYTTVTADTYAAEKLLDSDKVVLIAKTIASD